MDGIHRLIADIAAVLTVAAGLWALALVLSGRSAGPRFEQAQALVVSVFIVGAASGLLLLLGGGQPAEGLHFVYAAVAITLVPLARSFLGQRRSDRGRWTSPATFFLVAFIVLAAVTFRLFATG